MKRILIVSPSNDGTIARCSENLYMIFKENSSCIVKLVFFRNKGTGLESYEACEFFNDKNRSSFKNLFNIVSKIKWLKRIKKEFSPDITISTLNGCSTYNVLAGGKDRKIGIFHSPTYQLKSQFLNYFLVQFCFRFIYNKLDALVGVSDEITHYLKYSYPWIKSNKIKKVYNVHLFEKIRSDSNLELDSQEEDSIFNDNNVYLYCGRLDANKSPRRLLEAFAASELKNTKSCIVIIGYECDYTGDTIKRWANEMGIENQVFYLGPKQNPYRYMKRACALVSTSKSEGLPGVLIENLILEKPVISTNSSKGVWEILSCSQEYNPEFNSFKVLDDGIITSNISEEDINIQNLTKALNFMNNNKMGVTFKFKGELEPNKIISDFLNI